MRTTLGRLPDGGDGPDHCHRLLSKFRMIWQLGEQRLGRSAVRPAETMNVAFSNQLLSRRQGGEPDTPPAS
jgi:hypothetical protein